MSESPPLARRVQSFAVKRPASPQRSKSMLAIPTTSSINSASSNGKDKDSKEPLDANIRVAVRVRPLNPEERKQDVTAAVLCNSERNTVTVNYALTGGAKKMSRTWDFDKVFGMYSTQLEVFETSVRPILKEAMNGFNCTVFAYGPTGTGKTFSMEGDLSDDNLWGMVPRAAQAIFDQFSSADVHLTLKISFLEIYNEELRDLLAISNDRRLKLMEDLKRGVVCANLEEFSVKSMPEVMEYLRKGVLNRQTAATSMNLYSSRSHTIFTFRMLIDGFETQGDDYVKNGQINFVDLAGSECIGRSGATNDRAREAGSINQSLLTLGRVITALVDFHPHVPYRDSKLTRLLQESLGGKAKTCIIATVSPASTAAEESTFTIEYANRARSIKNQPQTNTQTASKQALKHYLQEIELLKQQLAQTRERNGVYLDNNDYVSMQAKLLAQENMVQESESTIRARDLEILALRKDKFALEAEGESQRFEIATLTKDNAELRAQLADKHDRLQATYVETKAQEKVIEEQAETEQKLLAHGDILIEAVKSNEGDLSNLLEKLQTLQAAEKERLQKTDSFVKTVQQEHAALAQQVQVLGQATSDQSTELGRGVLSVLQQSKSTAQALHNALSQALQVLVLHNQSNRLDMSSLNKEVREDNLQLHADLRKYIEEGQKQVDAWISGMNHTLSEAATQLDVQARQSVEAVESVNAQFTYLQDMNAAYLKQQEQVCRDLLAQYRTLRISVEAHCNKYEREAVTHLEETQADILTRASKIQKTVEALVEELLESSNKKILEAKSNATQMAASVVSTVSETVSGVESSTKKQLDEHQLQIDKYQIWTKTSRSGIVESIGKMAGPRDEAKTLLTVALPGQCATAHAQSSEQSRQIVQHLESVVSSVNAKLVRQEQTVQVHSEFTQDWCTQHDKTVFNEQQRMEAEMKSIADSMQHSINRSRDQLQSVAQAQQEREQAASRQVKEHWTYIQDSQVRPRGSTPTQLISTEIPTLPRTRDHFDITKEVLADYLLENGEAAWKEKMDELTRHLSDLSARIE